MSLYDFNPWWKTSSVPKHFTGQKRELFDNIDSFLDYRQIIILFGLRRAGKTTLLYQIIDFLLRKKEVDHFNILYFSFDEQALSLDAIFEQYQRDILKQRLDEKEKIYLFLIERAW